MTGNDLLPQPQPSTSTFDLGWAIIAALEQAGVAFDYSDYFAAVAQSEERSAAWFWRNKVAWDKADFRKAVVSQPHPQPSTSTSFRLKRAAEFVRYHAPEALKVFRLIVKNGNNRERSICEIASAKK